MTDTSPGAPAGDDKRMRLRYAGSCRLCGHPLAAGADAVYERARRTVRCVTCPEAGAATPGAPTTTEGTLPEPVRPGTAGASARREYERRRDDRERRVRERHPRIGGFLLAVAGEPGSTRAWSIGAAGEERLGARLDALDPAAVRVLHDRRVPRTRANIDHVAVTPTGVVVIDAKRYQGRRPSLRVEGGLLRPRVESLLVGNRDRTPLVEGVQRQVEVVRGVVGEDVPVTGVLCFVDAEWPLIGGSFTVRGVDVVWPRRLCDRLPSPGPLAARLDELHRRLAEALPPA
ncbi:nuclease-related domain-containing protein [Nocardioides bruguierae]|uniref:nuclease-related domain-containing protein n=1 Tax=Nocardioides bruguierae TaxID=2945102 RepID=UPI0020201262|nr:nuclease-related domain-containing protein [Nocardioides bruguierae]MCL8026380.1 NERD domain-containing protein [Nocardioides bruguierae]